MRHTCYFPPRRIAGALAAGSVVLLLHTACGTRGEEALGPAALTGTVRSAEEGLTEGVLVSARKAGSTITVTVVSDAQGRYRFPRARLDPGPYALTVRAVEYELDGPATVDIVAGRTASADLTLRRSPGTGLTNTEWIMSVPEPQQKAALRDQNCVRCHTLERVVRSRYTAEEWVRILTRMSTYATNSGANAPPQLVPHAAQILARPPSQQLLERARILATVNLSAASQWPYALKTLPRPTGRAAQVIYTTYDLSERRRQPHDVIVDSAGIVWYNDFGDQILGRLDPATGTVKEYPLPPLDPAETKGSLGIRFDPDENVWIGMFYQGAIGKFDTKTERLEVFTIPPELRARGRLGPGGRARLTEVSPQSSHVDGKVWVVNSEMQAVLRFDLASGDWEVFQPFPDSPTNIYDVLPDSRNNAYFTAFGREHIGRIDAKTGEIKVYPTPTRGSRPRRGSVDAQDRFWFGEHNADRIGMFDPRTETIREWQLPTPETFPYDAVADRSGRVWTGGMYSDRVVRLDPATGELVEYLLPRATNIRRVFVDNDGNFWVGSNHGAAIVKLQPLDAAPSLTSRR